jgi:hypothetical protein
MPTTYAIPDGRVAFNISLSNTGTTTSGGGVAKVISGLAFQPDMVWSKNRSSSTNARWGVIDSVRGVNKTLATNLTTAEITSQTDLLTSFNSNGVNIGADAGGYGWNWNQQSGVSDNYAYWLWKAGGTAVSNTAGSITSSVSANTTAGFSVATYTAPAGTFTFGHGLGVTPNFVIIKRTDSTSNWQVWATGFTARQSLYLNATNGADSSGADWFAVNSSTVQITTGQFTSTGNFVAYCFAQVAGYSAMGSYTGNGSADGPFVFLNFQARFVMLKRTDSTSDWRIYDSSRTPANPDDNVLEANTSDAEDTASGVIDILSNGFKLRDAGANNISGGTYIYACFASNPLKYSNAR